MDAYIINLSNIFDFDISMPILCSLIAEKKVWIPEEGGTFPVNPNEAMVCNRLFEFNSQFEHMRLRLDVTQTSAKPTLFIVLGYENWDFLPYGKLNGYPLFKIHYILDKLSGYFNKPHKNLPFCMRIFLTQQANVEWQEEMSMIEEKGYVEHESNEWFNECILDKELSFSFESYKSLFTGKKATDPIDGEVSKGLDEYMASFFDCLDRFGCDVSADVVEKWKQMFRDKIAEIRLISEFSKLMNTPTSFIRHFLYQHFSLKAQLDNLPPIYKYRIDISSAASGMRNKFEFAQFMLQFTIAPFLDEKNKLYTISSIEINVEALTPVLCSLLGVIENYKKKTVDLEKEELYHVFTVNDSYYLNLPTISNEERARYYSLRDIRRTIGWFYNRNKKEAVQKELDKNVFSTLESKIPMETGFFSAMLKDALNKQAKSITVKMIPTEITRFEQSRPVSTIDFKEYVIKRDALLASHESSVEDLLKTITVLPFQFNFFASLIAAIVCMFLFSVHLFSWIHLNNALSLLPVFGGLLILVAFFNLYKVRKAVTNQIDEIEEIRISLANNLSRHCEHIREAATQMAEAFAIRETLKELKEIRNRYDERSYRILAYENYHKVNEKNIHLLEKIYGVCITPTDTSAIHKSFDKHPEDDPNLIHELPINDIEVIINQQSNPVKNVHTIIKKIEIRSI